MPENPETVSRHSGVRRVNNLPIYLIGGAIAMFLILIMLVAIDRAKTSQENAEATPETPTDTSRLAQSIVGDKTGGVIPPADAPSSLPPDLPVVLPETLDTEPMPVYLQEPVETTDPESERIRQNKMQRFESAVTAKTNVPFAEPKLRDATDRRAQTLQRIADARFQVASAQQNDVNAAFKARLAELQGGDALDLISNSQRNDITQFDTKEGTDRWKLNAQVEAPESPYTLRAGFVIPASLISGINSDLPGQIIGQVSQNVYDTATGKYLLIPQGSRLVGTYTSDVAYGQSRVLVAWQRIVFPDGKALDIGAMPGADEAGYAGMNDKVNNHYWRLFGSAILMSGITAGVTLSQNDNNSVFEQQSARSALSEALGQQLGTVTAQMISKNLNISPTLEIRPGFRFNVMCVKDLVLPKPYALFDY